jgi:hypothetical protein
MQPVAALHSANILRWHGLANVDVIHDAVILKRDLEDHAHKYAIAIDRKITNGKLGSCAPTHGFLLKEVAMMFGFRKKAAPKVLPSNPGISSAGEVAFSNGQKTWTEHYNLVTLIASVLRELGYLIESEESWLVHPDSGFVLVPRLVQLKPLEKGGVLTTTTLQTNHPALVPDGVFEYQHATGDNVEDSLRKGFDQWAQTSLVALLDALQPMPATCTTLRMTFPQKDGKFAFARRAVLGPVTHLVQNAEVYAEKSTPGSGGDVQGGGGESHEFCPCCLLTRSFEAFRELIEDNVFYGLFLFAARDEKGVPQADCRVNGNDWEKGAQALRKYVTTWPEAGYEFRKQYVVLHTLEKDVEAIAGAL